MLMLYMPGVLFIDKDGVIRSQYEGRDTFLEAGSAEKNIRAEIEKMLAQPAVKKSPSKKKSAVSMPSK